MRVSEPVSQSASQAAKPTYSANQRTYEPTTNIRNETFSATLYKSQIFLHKFMLAICYLDFLPCICAQSTHIPFPYILDVHKNAYEYVHIREEKQKVIQVFTCKEKET